MAKKDFSAMNTGRAETAESSAVMRKLEQGASNKGQQGEATQQEAAERAAALRTQGRKGCKATRINMAFTPDNHEFIKVMARITGKTMTEFANVSGSCRSCPAAILFPFLYRLSIICFACSYSSGCSFLYCSIQ